MTSLSKGSTLNVGNMVVFRSTGRDGYELASQFDNTPPPPDKVMEAVHLPYKNADNGEQLFIQPKSTTGVGNLYHEVERLRRTYSDMEGERANQLSILPNFEAWCRLIHDQGNGKRPKLIERHIVTEKPIEKDDKEAKKDNMRGTETAAQIRKNSRKLAKTRDEVEKDIARRSFGEIEQDELSTAEKIS